MALPAELQQILEEAQTEMDKALRFLEQELARLRAGRVSPDLIEDVSVEYYGTTLPLRQLATISVRDARTLVVTPWDKNALESIEKAIQVADVGVTPSNDGENIILAFPPLTQEARQSLVKKAHQIAEQVRITIRNARRDALDTFRKKKKEGVAEDLIRIAEDELQKLTDQMIQKVEELVKAKEKSILEL